LPRSIFRYVLGTSGLHQLLLLALTVSVFLLEVVPLELQRRIVNDLVKHRPYSWVVGLCGVYAGTVLVQGGTKLALNIYRGWVGERAKRDLRRRVHTFVETPGAAPPAVEAQGISWQPSGTRSSQRERSCLHRSSGLQKQPRPPKSPASLRNIG
jgi:hypothetical protein